MERVADTTWYTLAWRVARGALVFLASLIICAGAAYTAYTYVMENYFSPVDADDSTPVEFVVKSSASLSTIARDLKEAELVRNKGVFQYTAEFQGAASKLKAGEYELSRNMTNQQILNILMAGDGKVKVLKITLTEGQTVEDMAASLVKQGALTDTRTFLELARTGESFKDDYDFIAALLEDRDAASKRKYALEGYLFPDTYEIYKDAEPDTIIRKMLNRTREVYNTQFLDAAEEQQLTIDYVLTLASIIEKEAKPADFAKVSAVFRNRLKSGTALESCVTVQYALKIKRLVLTADDLRVSSPYNTYRNKGLPVGPVSNPSRAAIDAALHPDAEALAAGYMYFCSKDPTEGELVFSKTYKEHTEATEQYKTLWEEYDKKNGY